MNDAETKALEAELVQFKKEKEQIRAILGRVGGVDHAKRDKLLNVVFVAILVLLLGHDVLQHALKFSSPLPPLVSIELGVLLVSVKIIWMIHKQSKVEHFQFWILSSIEFRLNDVARDMREVKRGLKTEEPAPGA